MVEEWKKLKNGKNKKNGKNELKSQIRSK